MHKVCRCRSAVARHHCLKAFGRCNRYCFYYSHLETSCTGIKEFKELDKKAESMEKIRAEKEHNALKLIREEKQQLAKVCECELAVKGCRWSRLKWSGCKFPGTLADAP